MDKIIELFKQFLNMEDDERIGVAAASVKEIMADAQKHGLEGKDALTVVIFLFKLFVSADADCTRGEYDLFLRVFGFTEAQCSSDEFFELTNHGRDAEFKQRVFNLVSALDEQPKLAVITLGCAICAHDGTMTVEEQQLIVDLLNC